MAASCDGYFLLRLLIVMAIMATTVINININIKFIQLKLDSLFKALTILDLGKNNFV